MRARLGRRWMIRALSLPLAQPLEAQESGWRYIGSREPVLAYRDRDEFQAFAAQCARSGQVELWLLVPGQGYRAGQIAAVTLTSGGVERVLKGQLHQPGGEGPWHLFATTMLKGPVLALIKAGRPITVVGSKGSYALPAGGARAAFVEWMSACR